jgi:hypothetical protein
VYTYDRTNARVIAYDKRSGDFVAQYRLAEGDGWADIRAMYVIAGVEEAPDTLVWLASDAIHQAVLDPVTPSDGASPAPSGSAAPGESAAASTPPS